MPFQLQFDQTFKTDFKATWNTIMNTVYRIEALNPFFKYCRVFWINILVGKEEEGVPETHSVHLAIVIVSIHKRK